VIVLGKKTFREIMHGFVSFQFLKFLIAGGTAALFNFLSFILFRNHFSHMVSIVLAFTVGTVISFILNKTFTFMAYSEKTAVQSAKFAVVAVGGYFLAVITAFLTIKIYEVLSISLITLQTAEKFAQAIAIGFVTVYNFLAMKYFSFNKLNLSKRGHRQNV
jgi:putative flippase GtrA